MDNKPTLLVINYTEDISGSSVSLVRLLDAVSDKIEFTLITSPGSYAARIADENKWQNLKTTLPLLDRRNLWFKWMVYLVRVVRLGLCTRRYCIKHKPDWILINSAMNIGWIPGWFITPARLKSRINWLVHELDVKPPWFYKNIIWIIEQMSDKIICVSSSVQNQFKRKTFLLPNIVSSIRHDDPINPLALKKIKLLWIATLVPRKGLHRLVEILSSLSSMGRKFSLEIVVSLRPRYVNYLRNCINDLKSAGIFPEVHENIDNPFSFYSSEKILLQTSEAPESFSLTPLEAMSRGMLVFASAKGGITDYGQHGVNLFFWEKLRDTLGDEIKRLTADPDKVLQIQNNALKTSFEYSPEKISERFMKILDEQ